MLGVGGGHWLACTELFYNRSFFYGNNMTRAFLPGLLKMPVSNHNGNHSAC